ncbi:hypothetical protein FISHEDRAFT_60943 [Fistulina hepatica ATCC 64428]|uniref:Uncharacterized protein n=1 Tax=Fistulina hepatica ATCC 64428 TaxID=1128425 RepID=A0A0D7A4U0_9AGAR|nr:hypothetical protein FISHEDRAFT_60943 [Fistulina hepatica ATCC 64428]
MPANTGLGLTPPPPGCRPMRPLQMFHQFSLNMLENLTNILPAHPDLEDEDNTPSLFLMPARAMRTITSLNHYISKQFWALQPPLKSGTKLKAVTARKWMASVQDQCLDLPKVSMVNIHVVRLGWVGEGSMTRMPCLIMDNKGIIFDLLAGHPVSSDWHHEVVDLGNALLQETSQQPIFSPAKEVG